MRDRWKPLVILEIVSSVHREILTLLMETHQHHTHTATAMHPVPSNHGSRIWSWSFLNRSPCFSFHRAAEPRLSSCNNLTVFFSPFISSPDMYVDRRRPWEGTAPWRSLDTVIMRPDRVDGEAIVGDWWKKNQHLALAAHRRLLIRAREYPRNNRDR